MTPYYQDEAAGITIYHGRCEDVLPTLGDNSADLLLTDPPYGIAATWKGGFSALHGWARAAKEKDARNEWDAAPPNAQTIRQCLRVAREAVIWGGNHFELPPSRGWLVWNKPERNFTLAEAELAWTTRDAVIRVKDLPRSEPRREHPTQKPLALFTWCLSFFPDAQVVIDPFMGSGTTLRAAKDFGRRSIGIDLDERWCDFAARRLQQSVLPWEVPA